MVTTSSAVEWKLKVAVASAPRSALAKTGRGLLKLDLLHQVIVKVNILYFLHLDLRVKPGEHMEALVMANIDRLAYVLRCPYLDL